VLPALREYPSGVRLLFPASGLRKTYLRRL
jgi:hypothetical protein